MENHHRSSDKKTGLTVTFRASVSMQSAILLWQIRPSVCPSHFGILSKQMHTSSNYVHRLVGTECYRHYRIPRDRTLSAGR